MAIELWRTRTISSANCAPTVYVEMSVVTCDGGMLNDASVANPARLWTVLSGLK